MKPEELPIEGLEDVVLRRVRTADDLLEIAEVYIESFPEAERRPMRVMRQAIAREEALFWRICKSEETLGLLTTWELSQVVYGEHFAMRPRLRNMGVGAKALRTVMAVTHCPILIEVEPPEEAIQQRRMDFYLREGFHVVDTNYVQPPYDPSLASVPLYLMCTDAGMVGARLEASVEELRRVVFVRYE